LSSSSPGRGGTYASDEEKGESKYKVETYEEEESGQKEKEVTT
jgi:hypothetical protein